MAVAIASEPTVKFLEGDKVYLRPLLRSDMTTTYLAWLNDPAVTVYSKLRNYPTNEKELEAYLENQKGTSRVVLAVCAKPSGVHIGNVVLEDIDWIDRTAQLTALIGLKQYWGTGHFLESFALVQHYAFRNLNLNRLYAGTENPGVTVSLKKLGWRTEGMLRQHRFRDGAYRDLITMAIVKSDWEKPKRVRPAR